MERNNKYATALLCACAQFLFASGCNLSPKPTTLLTDLSDRLLISQAAASGVLITNVNPKLVAKGGVFAIEGEGFSAVHSIVFDKVVATPAVDSSRYIRVVVPTQALTGAFTLRDENNRTLASAAVRLIGQPQPTSTPTASPSSSPTVKPKPTPAPISQAPDDPSHTPASLGEGYRYWKEAVQPALVKSCTPCHLGERFGLASLKRSGETFTEAESQSNYDHFLDMISLDAPEESRLLAKIKAPGNGGTPHADFSTNPAGDDSIRTKILTWAQKEKAEKCPNCGLTSQKSYIGYVEQPEKFWAIDRYPNDGSYGTRTGARIMLQPVQPSTLQPVGAPVDFLGSNFLGNNAFCSNNDCDFGFMSPNHAGTQLVFECRIPLHGEKWINRSWNICIAEISSDGHAVNPRFLLPERERHSGWDYARTTPFGYLGDDGIPLKSVFDDQYQIRQRNDFHPIFSPDDQKIYFLSQAADPRSGDDAVETYHGEKHLANLVATDLEGKNRTLIYKNDGGEADSPFFRKNGNIGLHTWNLERIDRHKIIQGTPDGMMELPVLLGAIQGPNMWGRTVELNNGVIITMTGARRGAHEQFAPFAVDHTLGTGLDPSVKSSWFVIPGLFEEILPYPNGFCSGAPAGPNCTLSKLITEPAWAPNGKALVTYNSDRVYLAFGEGTSLLRQNTSSSLSLADRFEAIKPYLPKKMGTALLDSRGNIQPLLKNAPGKMNRYPVWIGKRQAPRIQTWKTNDRDLSTQSTNFHIADVPIWMSFQFSDTNKAPLMSVLDQIKSVRIFYKDMSATACVRDTGSTWAMVNSGNTGMHPTAFGIADATGYVQYLLPGSLGGDRYGDIPVKSDGSVHLKLPAGKLFLFQGVDSSGHVVAQKNRLFSLPPGHSVDVSVRRGQYAVQCARCHGNIDGSQYSGLKGFNEKSAPIDFDTEAKRNIIDLTPAAVVSRKMDYLHSVRTILDRPLGGNAAGKTCVSCHSGAQPSAGLSLSNTYSGNYPQTEWANPERTIAQYLGESAPKNKQASYDFSLSYRYTLSRSDGYKDYSSSPYLSLIQSDTPVGARAPWDPGYQNLFRRALKDPYNSYYYYLSDDATYVELGKSSRLGGNSRSSRLIRTLRGSHAGMLSEDEIRQIAGVIDVGFPYMGRCDDKVLPWDGLPNAGQSWGDTQFHRFEFQ